MQSENNYNVLVFLIVQIAYLSNVINIVYLLTYIAQITYMIYLKLLCAINVCLCTYLSTIGFQTLYIRFNLQIQYL